MNKKIVYAKKMWINNIEVVEFIEFQNKEEVSKYFKDNNFNYPLSKKQWGLLKFLKGDDKKTFKSEAEFTAYINELKSVVEEKEKNGEQFQTELTEKELKDIPFDFDY